MLTTFAAVVALLPVQLRRRLPLSSLLLVLLLLLLLLCSCIRCVDR